MLQDSLTIRRISGNEISSLRAGGVLQTVVEPKSIAEIEAIAERFGGELKILGKVSNTLIPDEGFHKPVLLTRGLRGIDLKGNILEAGGGEGLTGLAYTAGKNRLCGLEKLAGIPGSVGGAVIMNAGSYGLEIGTLVKKVFVYRLDLCKIEEYSGEELDFSYRYSRLLGKKGLVIGVRLELSQDDENVIREREMKYKLLRRLSQPSLPSLGSVFKRINGVSAGYYIDRVGLRGETKNDMMISSCHANIIVNVGKGRAQDYVFLMNLAKKRVFEEYGITLEREVEILGEE